MKIWERRGGQRAGRAVAFGVKALQQDVSEARNTGQHMWKESICSRNGEEASKATVRMMWLLLWDETIVRSSKVVR